MPMAHVCAGCGENLARVRALIEPHYGLPLIVCPRCESPCVRRRHPIVAGWRAAWRIMRVAFALVVRLVAIVLFFAVWMAFIVTLAGTIESYGWQSALFTDREIIAVGIIGLPLVIGAVLRVLLYHLRPWLMWLLWAAFCIGSVGLFILLRAIAIRLDGSTMPSFADFLPAAVLFLVSWAFMWPGIAIGGGAHRLYQRWRSMRRSEYRKRVRQRRST
jgi:hypothetical protein